MITQQYILLTGSCLSETCHTGSFKRSQVQVRQDVTQAPAYSSNIYRHKQQDAILCMWATLLVLLSNTALTQQKAP